MPAELPVQGQLQGEAGELPQWLGIPRRRLRLLAVAPGGVVASGQPGKQEQTAEE
jgi:hypothetical protein